MPLERWHGLPSIRWTDDSQMVIRWPKVGTRITESVSHPSASISVIRLPKFLFVHLLYNILFLHYISNVDRYSHRTFYFLLDYTFQNYLLAIFNLQLRIWKNSNFFEKASLRPYALIQQLTISIESRCISILVPL